MSAASLPRSRQLDTVSLQATLEETIEVVDLASRDTMGLPLKRATEHQQQRAAQAVVSLSHAGKHLRSALRAIDQAGGAA